MLIGGSGESDGQTVRAVGFSANQRDSAKSEFAGSTRPRVGTLRKSTPLPPSMITRIRRQKQSDGDISSTVTLPALLSESSEVET